MAIALFIKSKRKAIAYQENYQGDRLIITSNKKAIAFLGRSLVNHD
jgi:hypothetical protein